MRKRGTGSWDTQEGGGTRESQESVLESRQVSPTHGLYISPPDSYSWGDKFTLPGGLLRRTGRLRGADHTQAYLRWENLRGSLPHAPRIHLLPLETQGKKPQELLFLQVISFPTRSVIFCQPRLLQTESTLTIP